VQFKRGLDDALPRLGVLLGALLQDAGAGVTDSS